MARGKCVTMEKMGGYSMQTVWIVLMILIALLNVFSVYVGAMALFTFKRRRPYPKAEPVTRFAVIVPARNEEGVIGNLIAALRAQSYPRNRFDIIVAVNNTTDRTAEVAMKAGAKVFHCTGDVRCKGDVLHQVIEYLTPMGYDAYAVFDADNLPDPAFLQRMNDALAAGERVCKGRLKAGNATESWVSGGYGLYHALMEWTYSRPHAAAGLSSNLVGTGFVFHREIMDKLGGWNTVTICEDSEFIALCAQIGVRVAWVYEALSYDEQVTKFGISLRQRHRWCSGMVATARRYLGSLLRSDVPNRKVALDFATLLILSHTSPLAMVLTVLAMPLQPVWMLLTMVGSVLLTMAAMMLLAVLLCVLGGYRLRGMGKTILMFPVFMASWLPIQIVSLVAPARQWHEIHHQGQPDAELAS